MLITHHEPEVEKLLRANGTVFKRKNADIIRYELDTNHYYYIGGVGYVPGVTTILDEAGPVGYGLREFWKNNTKAEGEQLFNEAGEFGTKMHDAYEQLLEGFELNLVDDYPTTREKDAVLRFADWFNVAKPTNFLSELVVASTKYKFAGTLDFVGKIKRIDAAEALMFKTSKAKAAFIGGKPNKYDMWLIDFKTSKGLHFNHELQVAAYRQAVWESLGIRVDHIGLLRVPTTHAIGYEFRKVDRKIGDFMYLYRTYLNLHGGQVPKPKEIKVYPKTFKLLEAVTKENKRAAQ